MLTDPRLTCFVPEQLATLQRPLIGSMRPVPALVAARARKRFREVFGQSLSRPII